MKHLLSRYLFPILLISGISALILQTGCKKEQLLQSGGSLRFSADTLTFDTVFTSLGSFTLGMKIYNPQNQRISLSSVHMEQGASSPFHLNVDGSPGPEVKQVEIAANDSAYIFATVNIDPNNANSPFVVEDKLVATLNGTDFKVPFRALGQNAHYIIDSLLKTQTWQTDKPYVIIHSAAVDENETLTIPAGCRIYMHADSRLLVFGTLKVNGTLHDSVIFQGDRLDRKYFGYEGYPGEWGGLYFHSFSKNNELHHTILRNCGNTALGALPAAIEVYVDSVHGPNPQLYLDRTTIENSIGYGLLSFGGTVKAENCLIHSCGAYALALVQGGDYTLDNCTIAVYGNDKINHTENAAAILLNYYKLDEVTLIKQKMKAELRNCVIWGSLLNELIIDSVAGAPCDVSLDHCVAKMEPSRLPAWVVRNSLQLNVDPLFVDYAKWNYRLKTGSPLVDAGMPLTGANVIFDLDDYQRSGNWDIGAYERH